MNAIKKILEEKIVQCYKSPMREFLTSMIKPAINLVSIEGSKKVDGFSKIGGIPLVKKGEEWPRTKNDDNPLFFLLQIDLKELVEFDLEEALPKSGILSFFFDCNNLREGLVKYYNDDEELVKCDLPKEFHEIENRKKLPFFKRFFVKPRFFQIYKECKIEFGVEYQIPSSNSIQVELFEKEKSRRIFDFIIDDLLIENHFLVDDANGKHHLLGYYEALQDTPYELTKRETDRFQRRASTEATLIESLEWRILLKLGSDTKTEMNWIDAGNLFFFIKKEDLEKGQFNNVRAYLDTT